MATVYDCRDDREIDVDCPEHVRSVSSMRVQDRRSAFESSSTSQRLGFSPSSSSSTSSSSTTIPKDVTSVFQWKHHTKRPTAFKHQDRSKSLGDNSTISTISTNYFIQSAQQQNHHQQHHHQQQQQQKFPTLAMGSRSSSGADNGNHNNKMKNNTFNVKQKKTVEQEPTPSSCTTVAPAITQKKLIFSSWDSQPLSPIMMNSTTLSSSKSAPSPQPSSQLQRQQQQQREQQKKSTIPMKAATNMSWDDKNSAQKVSCVKPSEILKKAAEEAKKTKTRPQLELPRSVSVGNVKALTTVFDVEKMLVARQKSVPTHINNHESDHNTFYGVSSLKKVCVTNNYPSKHIRQQPLSPPKPLVNVKTKTGSSPSETFLLKQRPVSTSSVHSFNSKSSTSNVNLTKLSPSFQDAYDDEEKKRNRFSAILPLKHGPLTSSWKAAMSTANTATVSKELDSVSKELDSSKSKLMSSQPSPKMSRSQELEALRAMSLAKKWSSTNSLLTTKTSEHSGRRSLLELSSGSLSSVPFSSKTRRNSVSVSTHSSTAFATSKTARQSFGTSNDSTSLNHLNFEQLRNSLKKVSNTHQEKNVVHRWNPTDTESSYKSLSRKSELDDILALRLAKETQLERPAVDVYSQKKIIESGDFFFDSQGAQFVNSPQVAHMSRTHESNFAEASSRAGVDWVARQSDASIYTCEDSSDSNVVSCYNRSVSSSSAEFADFGATAASTAVSGGGRSLRSATRHNTSALDAVGDIAQSLSMKSDFTASSQVGYYSYEGADDYDDDENRYIQISLSSGGIATKFVPNVTFGGTENSDDMDARYHNDCQSTGSVSSTDSPVKIQIQNDRRKSGDLLKGAAKRFFFGKCS